MVDVKINDLASAVSVNDSMQLETDLSGLTANKVTALQIKTYVLNSLDHGTLTGLSDDDHTLYSLSDGTRWTTTPTANRVVISDASGYIGVSGVTTTTLGYLDATSSIQTQLNSKYDSDGDIDHGGINGLSDDDHSQYSLANGTRWTTTPTASRVPISDSSGNLVVSSTTTTQLGYLDATSSIQTQLNSKYDTDTDVDHDASTNFVSNEHIDHTSVSIDTGSGLTGGGDLTSTRTLSVDLNGLTSEASVDSANDYFMMYDASATALRKVLGSNLPGGGGGSSTFTGLTDTPSSYTSQASKIVAVNSGETALEFIDPTSGVGTGSTLPTSPTTGQLFYHTPTGRNWLMLYNGSSWVPLLSTGTTTIYVDTVASGSQDWDEGYSSGTAWDFEWISARFPSIIDNTFTINCASGDYTGDIITLQGIKPKNGTCIVQGAFTEVYTGLSYSSIDANHHVVTFGSTVSSAVKGDIIRPDSVTSVTGSFVSTISSGYEDYACFRVLSSSGSTITLIGRDDDIFDSSTTTWRVLRPTSEFDFTTIIIADCVNLTLRDINFSATTSSIIPWRGKNCSLITLSGVEIDCDDGRIEMFDGFGINLYGCYLHGSPTKRIMRLTGSLNLQYLLFTYIENTRTTGNSVGCIECTTRTGRCIALGCHFDVASTTSGANCINNVGGYIYFGTNTTNYNYFTGSSGNYGVSTASHGSSENIVGRGTTSGLSGLSTVSSATFGLAD